METTQAGIPPLVWSIIAAAVVLVLAMLVGLFKGKGPFGVLVDGRGKYSLSKLQILLWTALIVSGYFGISFPRLSFIDIPAEVLGLLGVSLGSAVASAAIKANKITTGRTATEEERNQAIIRSTQLHMLRLLGVENPEALSQAEVDARLAAISDDERKVLETQVAQQQKPSWMDFFSQEQKGTEHLIDIGKFQMFAWTIVALVIYGAKLVGVLQDDVTTITAMPPISGPVLSLMAISQAAYLGMKLPDRA